MSTSSHYSRYFDQDQAKHLDEDLMATEGPDAGYFSLAQLMELAGKISEQKSL